MPNDSGWYRCRGYLHFDAPMSRLHAESIVKSPSEVARHAFYPLIGYKIESRKIRKDPVRQRIIEIPKSREIRYAAHLDSLIYGYYAEILGMAYESEVIARNLGANVLAFRKLGKSNIDFAAEAFDSIRSMGPCVALAFDVTGFFDNLDHAKLKTAWAHLLKVPRLPADHFAIFRSLTRYSWVERSEVYRGLSVSGNTRGRELWRLCTAAEFRKLVRDGGMIHTNLLPRGIPQGSPISALLSNVYMLDFDAVLRDFALRVSGYYFRYCDDLLLVVPTEATQEAEALVASELGKLLLTLNIRKTEKVAFERKGARIAAEKPLQYLGFLFDGSRVLLRSSSLARFSARMSAGVRLAHSTAKSKNAIRQAMGLSVRATYKRKLYERYSHLGKRNFVRYGLRAAARFNAKSIRQQLKPLWNMLKGKIESP